MSTIKIYRYSNTGFKPCLQNHLLEHASIDLDSMLSQIDNDYLKELVKKGYTLPDPDFEYDGIFVFLNKPSNEDRRYYLNHLKTNTTQITLHIGEIVNTAFGYIDDGSVFKKENKMTIKEAVEKNIETFYIPLSQIQYIQDMTNIVKHRPKII